MAIIIVTKKSLGGEYNLATDPGAGAAGAIGTGVFLPPNSVITRFWIKTLTTFVAGVGTTVGFTMGTGGKDLFAPTIAGALIGGAVASGVDFNANPEPLNVLAVPQVIFVIAGAFPLTAGRVTFVIDYTEMDF